MLRIVARITLIASLIIASWYFIAFGKDTYPFYGDAMGYYMYLPTTFIYHNFTSMERLPEKTVHFDYLISLHLEKMRNESPKSPKGYIVDKYTYGVAALEMPFFLIAHGYEKIAGRPATGYSFAYKAMLKCSALFYALFGLILVYKTLNFFFSKDYSLIGTTVIFIGSNLFWFTLYQAGMSHVPLFFLYALLLYTTILLHQRPKPFLFVLAGFTAGLITLIRPTDVICLLIPLLYNVYNTETIKQKAALIKTNKKSILFAAIVFVLPMIPQMIYWKTVAGSYIYYSYENEHFNWLQPRVWEGLFSFSNGWLAYSPVMVFSIIGILMYRKIKPFIFILLTLLPIYIYVIYSWYCYNYINGLGSRPMLHMYPLLALPLTALIARVSESKLYWKVITVFLFVFFIGVNITYSIQQAKRILFSEESGMTYNLHMLFKTTANYNDLVINDIQQLQPNTNMLEKVQTLECHNYDDSLNNRYEADTTKKSKYVYHMHNDDEYHPDNITINYNKAIFKDARWLQCSGDFLCRQHYSYLRHLLTLEIRKGDNISSWVALKIDNKIGLTEPDATPDEFTFDHCELNKWGHLYFFYKIPANLHDGDRIRMDVWNIGKQELYFDNLCLELYRDK